MGEKGEGSGGEGGGKWGERGGNWEWGTPLSTPSVNCCYINPANENEMMIYIE